MFSFIYLFFHLKNILKKINKCMMFPKLIIIILNYCDLSTVILYTVYIYIYIQLQFKVIRH